MRKLAAAFPLLLSLASAQEAVIQSDNSRRTLNHWSASAAPPAKAARLASGESRSFHWAAFSGIVGPALEQDMRAHGIEILGLAGRPGTLKLYKVHVPGDAAAALAYLRAVTGFVNLLPILREEKISRGLLDASGEARKATVLFHRNLPYPEMEALLKGRVDAIHRDQDSRLLHVTASPARLRALADLEEVAQVREEIKKEPVNYQSRVLTKVDALQAGTVDLTSFPPTPEWNRGVAYTGDSIHVGVNEGFDLNHRDFNEQLPGGTLKPRLSHGTAGIASEFHGSHVAGTIGGNGWLSELNDLDGQEGSDPRYLHRGVAPKTLLSAWGDKGDVNNHSFTNGFEAFYNGSDAYVDDRLSQHISLQEDWNNVAVWSAANNGGSWAQYGFQRGFYSMLINAKNPIKVGASDFQGIRTYFSSMGPTRDGRWGPDVVAPGEGILSVAAQSDGYTWMSGTSMSGPHVTGITALIMQKYRDAILRKRTPLVSVHENPMWNSTVKAILIHTATDMVDLTGQSFDNNPDFESAGFPNQPTVYTAGPDWATGFGMVNAQKALQFVDSTRFREDVVDAGATRTYTLSVPAGLGNLRVTLAWDDPEYAGIADQSNAYAGKLVNDLDLEVAPPTGNPWLPWTLDHAPLHNGTVPTDGLDPITPSEILDRPAVRGRDGVNNVEVVDIPNPAAGTWTIRVRGQAITVDQSPIAGLNQDFSLVSDLALPPAPSNGPDLIVSRLLISPSIPGIGRPLTFKAEVTNIGNAPTPSGTPFQVDLRALNNVFSFSTPYSQVLQPGQSVIVALDQPAPGGSGSASYPVNYGGSYDFTAIVDHAGAIAEQSEHNNTWSEGVAIPSLPEPWQNRDIGYSGPNTRGTITILDANPINGYIEAYGADIYGNRDEFHYLYRPLTGDGEIVSRVQIFGGEHEWAKAGLMIREDLTPESRNAFVAVTRAHGTSFQHRSATGGATVTGEVPSDAQGFLKLTRAGSQITGYRSDDGVSWTQVGTVTLALPATVYVGFAMTSHDPIQYANAWFTLKSLTGGFTNAVRGRVLDQAAKPLAGVSVAISGAGCGAAVATTDAGGWYALAGIAAGSTCTVTPSRSGFTFEPSSATFADMRIDNAQDFTGSGTVEPELPAPWVQGAVGAVGQTGSAAYAANSGQFTVKGSGADIWDVADGFHFVHQPLTGDVQMTARVVSIQNTDPWAKAGIMIRESTAPGARHALMAVTAANGTAFQRRTVLNGQSEHTGISGAAPRWVRLVRTGSNVKGYHSADGSAWTLVGEANLAFGAQVLVGLAVTSHNNAVLATSVFDNVSLQTVTPQVFTASDIGPTGRAGSTQVSNGTYTLQGAGADIWEAADGFHFYHRSMSGDGSITARVVSLTNTHAWAKAGVMIRESTAVGARHVYTGLTPANGAEFLRRDVVNGTTSVTPAPATAPYWVRLTRVGNVFTSFVSSNGTTWTQVGTATLAMAADVRVGFAACSHDTAALLTGVFDNVTIVE